MFPLASLNDVNIPEVIYITWGYDVAFENEEMPLKMLIPQNSKDLYEMMLQTPDLCGTFALLSDDGNIVWNLYDDITKVHAKNFIQGSSVEGIEEVSEEVI